VVLSRLPGEYRVQLLVHKLVALCPGQQPSAQVRGPASTHRAVCIDNNVNMQSGYCCHSRAHQPSAPWNEAIEGATACFLHRWGALLSVKGNKSLCYSCVRKVPVWTKRRAHSCPANVQTARTRRPCLLAKPPPGQNPPLVKSSSPLPSCPAFSFPVLVLFGAPSETAPAASTQHYSSQLLVLMLLVMMMWQDQRKHLRLIVS